MNGQAVVDGLRSRALAAVDEGMSYRAVACWFGVAAATVIRWHDQRRSTGGYGAKAQGGDTWSRRIEAHRDTLSTRHASSRGTGSRVRKDRYAAEQDRTDVLSAREAWFDGQLDLDPERLVFIDETWTATNMTRSHGRCRRGERLRMGYPHAIARRPRWSPGCA